MTHLDTLPADQLAGYLCPNGHAYTPENTATVWDRGVYRRCRRCHRAADAAYRARRRAAAEASDALWDSYTRGRKRAYADGLRAGYRRGWSDHVRGCAFRSPGRPLGVPASVELGSGDYCAPD